MTASKGGGKVVIRIKCRPCLRTLSSHGFKEISFEIKNYYERYFMYITVC